MLRAVGRQAKLGGRDDQPLGAEQPPRAKDYDGGGRARDGEESKLSGARLRS
jgi:hypothetical protein